MSLARLILSFLLLLLLIVGLLGFPRRFVSDFSFKGRRERGRVDGIIIRAGNFVEEASIVHGGELGRGGGTKETPCMRERLRLRARA